MAHAPPKSPLARRIAFGLQLVDELIELVEIYARLEPERVWDGFRCGTPARFGRLAETGTKCPVEDILEWQPQLAGLSLQEPSQIIINCECGAHVRHHGASNPDVKTSSRRSHWTYAL
jgi:hypothetical protein